MKGTLMFVLHSHIPYVRKKGKFPFGEEWLYEAILDSYLPLLKTLENLCNKNLKTGITLGLTPVLLEQLKDAYMLKEFEMYTKQRIKFCINNYEKFKANNQLKEASLALRYKENYENLLTYFGKLNKDVISAFKEFQNKQNIEIITSAFSHGYLPLLKNKNSVRLQLELGVKSYRDNFDQDPVGIWLPECAYKPGLDYLLKENGLKYFITDAHAIIGGKALGLSSYGGELNTPFSPIRPYTTFNSYQLKGQVTVLGRNLSLGGQVWSADFGYPGEASYREFHKKDCDSGLQYWQITDKDVPLHEKKVYDPLLAQNKVLEHANHFVSLADSLFERYQAEGKASGLILTPFDTELFGHWWHEGVDWLEKTIELLNAKTSINLAQVKDYLASNPPEQIIDLPESSWGAGGKHDVWLNHETSWIWDIIHKAEDKFWSLNPSNLKFDNPLVHEFLLLQSSDWPFLVTTGQAKEYGKKRVLEHYEKFIDLIANT